MKLLITKRAYKDLRGMPKSVAGDIQGSMEQIALDPFAARTNVERLQGRKDAWRLRKGDLRAVYSVDRARDAVVLERVMNRRDVYR
jgi:mRNA interferase RelE/StbE